MKKILEKIVTITLAFIALVFVILMLVILFKPGYAENLDNPFVQVLMIIFAAIFAVLTAINIATAFTDHERINSVLLFKSKESATKASISVVNKTAKQATAIVPGAKLKKVYLFVDENNDVRMRIDLKVKADDVESIVTAVRAALVLTFEEVMGLTFANIDFRLVKVKNEHKPDSAKMDEKITEFKKELETEKKLAAEQKALEEAKPEALTETEEAVEITADEATEALETADETVLSDDAAAEAVEEAAEVEETVEVAEEEAETIDDEAVEAAEEAETTEITE